VIRKNNDPADASGLLHYEALGGNAVGRARGDQVRIEEFGICARDVLIPEMLLKEIGYELQGPVSSRVYLAYNWKHQLPFVIIRHEHQHVSWSYKAQYGHEGNYPESKSSEITFRVYSCAELTTREPETAALMKDL
jgi:hypothetical protein